MPTREENVRALNDLIATRHDAEEGYAKPPKECTTSNIVTS
jgi:hypothetical protein